MVLDYVGPEICSPTGKDTHWQARHKYHDQAVTEPYMAGPGPCKAATRTILDSTIILMVWIKMAVLNIPNLLDWTSPAPRTFLDVQGSIRPLNTSHVGYDLC
ncbi:hypothetical protein DPMN_011429 [Dreissena polymorpha]|uniref:Uncharacterized protein n=1 Tax=Dreissena polymorpha TaxID=45954 RepID=A0A9D4N644_DREPO|nr:hypothetical protein DPMN_011429 [Dreissena polymorpha]